MRGSGAVACVTVVLLLLLPLFYVLSLGPAIWMHDRGMMSPQVTSVCEAIYSPLEWLTRGVPFVKTPLEAYVSLWQRAQPAPALPVPTPSTVPTQAASPAAAAPTAATAPGAESTPDLSEPAVCR